MVNQELNVLVYSFVTSLTSGHLYGDSLSSSKVIRKGMDNLMVSTHAKHSKVWTMDIDLWMGCIWFIGANMGPIWGQQDPGGTHVGPMNFVIWGG